MTRSEALQRVAAEIIHEVQREFPGTHLELDLQHPRREDEDAYLWVSTDATDDEEVGELWGYVIGLVQDAFRERDLHIVARMRGRDVVMREKKYDTE